jgi:hypothetical protein
MASTRGRLNCRPGGLKLPAAASGPDGCSDTWRSSASAAFGQPGPDSPGGFQQQRQGLAGMRIQKLSSVLGLLLIGQRHDALDGRFEREKLHKRNLQILQRRIEKLQTILF